MYNDKERVKWMDKYEHVRALWEKVADEQVEYLDERDQYKGTYNKRNRGKKKISKYPKQNRSMKPQWI